MKRLSHRHEIFCYKYLETQNATEAYLLAGYKVTRSVARRNGARLLTNDDILAFLEKTRINIITESKINLSDLIYQLSRIAFGKGFGEVAFVKDGGFHLKEDASLEIVSTVSHKVYSGKSKKGYSFSIRMEDRIEAIDLLCKILGFYKSQDTKVESSFEGAAKRILEALAKRRNPK